MRTLRRRRLAALVPAFLAVSLLVWDSTQHEASARAADFVPGSAVAETQPLAVNIAYNEANIGFSFATARSSFADRSAKASASAFNFGLTQLVSAIEMCGHHPLPEGLLPSQLTASSDEGEGETVRARSGQDGPFSFIPIDLEATPGASASSRVEVLGLEVPGLVEIDGGESRTSASTDPATETRTAQATTRADIELLGGLVVVEGLEFSLHQTSAGTDAETSERTVTSDFVVGGLRVAGVRVPLPAPTNDQLDAVNEILGPLGIRFHAPDLVDEGSFSHRITPLTISLAGDSIYADLIATTLASPQFIELMTALQDNLFDTTECKQLGGLFEPAPELNSLYNALGLYGPIAVAIVSNALAGDGTVDVQIGGARTSIDDRRFVAPTYERAAPTPTTTTPATTVPPATPSPAPAPVAAAPPTPTTTVVTEARHELVAAPVSSTACQTTSPAGRPGCWDGLAVPAAAGLFALTIGTVAIDELRRRRRVGAPALTESPRS